MTQTNTEPGTFGSLLKAFRQRRRLTQQQLAQSLGMSRNAIGRWEQGDFLPASKTMVLELTRALQLDEQETRQLLEASLTALSPHWSVPFARNPFFTGREEILQILHDRLGSHQAVVLTQSYALHGLGGIGKTQIALEYAYRYALDYRAVLWIGAETVETITSSLLRIAEALQLPGREEQDVPRVIGAVQRWLSTHHQWLVICDNVDDPALLHDFLPLVRQGTLLLTTHCPALGPLALGLDVPPMGVEEARLLLLRRASVLAPGATQEQVRQVAAQRPAEYAAAEELVTVLGSLPLALDQAGAYLQETGCSVAEYLQRYQQQRAPLLSRRGTSAGYHPQSVATTFQLSMEQVRRLQPATTDFLQICALLQAEAIPEELLLRGARYLGSQLEALGVEPLSFDQIIAVLRRFSLIERQAETHTLSLHRLVQAVVWDAMTTRERKLWSRRVIEALDALFPRVHTAMERATWVQCERLLPHALFAFHQELEAEPSLAFASLAYKVAEYLRERGRYGEAEPLYQQALAAREQLLGAAHPEVARALFPLAILSLNLGKYAQAEACYQRALRIYEQHPLEANQREIARLLNNLGNLSLTLGKYGQAEVFYQRTLTLQEQEMSQEHPDEVARSLHNLAFLSARQGRYREAEPLYRRALSLYEAYEHQCGATHPDMAITLHALATLLREQGKYQQAEVRSQEALHISERYLGPGHPQGAMVLHGLATLFYEQGRYQEAEPLYQRALQINECHLGSEHFTVAMGLHGLATLLCEQGKDAEAEPLYQQALRIWERQLGPEHPDMALALNDLARLYQSQGKYREAELLYQRAGDLYERTFGPEHPHMARILANLATLLCKQGKYQQAEPLYREALQISESRLSPEHPQSAMVLHGLATLLCKQGKHQQAEPLYQRALVLREQQLGQQHPQTAETLHALALLHQKRGNLGEAISFARRAVQIRSQVLGDAHATTVAARKLSTQLLQEQASTQEDASWE